MKKNLLIAIVAMVMLGGCKLSPAAIDQWAADNQAGIRQANSIANGVAVAAAPVTGGVSLLVMQIASVLLPSLLAANRSFVAFRRKQDTRRIVAAIDTAKIGGKVDFNDATTQKVMSAVMGRSGKLAVDKAQGKV